MGQQSTKIILSTSKLNLSAFAESAGVFRKDFVRVGNWWIAKNRLTLPVDAARIDRWAKNFQLMLSRGITIPLTVDHDMVLDPKTGQMVKRPLSPAMAEAKRGEIINLFRQDDRGMFDVKPADAESVTLMNRCPEVSLELTPNFVDAYKNVYDEAITAITLTPIPVIPGQLEFEKIAASRATAGDETIYLSAEPITDGNTTLLEPSMKPEHIAKARTMLKLADNTPDADVEGAVIKHLELCTGGTMLSRADHDAAVKVEADKVIALSRQVDELKAGKEPTTLNLSRLGIDEDAMDMAADAMTARVDGLLTACKITPAQKPLLLSLIAGAAGKRPAIMLSRKAAGAVGLSEPLAKEILAVLEAGNPGELAKLLEQQTASQKTLKLSHDPSKGSDEPLSAERKSELLAGAGISK